MIVAITPVPMFPSSGCQLALYAFTIAPNVTLTAQYRILDCSGNPLTAPQNVTLTSGQYVNWSGQANDEVYLPTCLAANLGLTFISGLVP
jgi:hypothetical protein